MHTYSLEGVNVQGRSRMCTQMIIKHYSHTFIQ
jgi:hypothetical protein